MKKSNPRIGLCPDSNCSGGSPGRQQTLTAAQIDRLDPKTREAAGAAAKRCSYCGCIYKTDAHNMPTIFGWLDSGVLGEGWHPKKRS
jgi:hypothetical protein